MPFRRDYRASTSLIVIAFTLVSIALTAPSSATAEIPDRTRSSTAAVAVVDAIVVNTQKQSTASPGDVSLIRAGTSTPGGVDVGTQLEKGDELITGAQDQVTLRFLNGTEESPNLVYMDENTAVTISSACLKSGRILAWVGISFKFCIGNTTLGVEGTEFEVSAIDNAPPKVAVLKGKVFLETAEPSEPVAAAARVAGPVGIRRLEVQAKEEATITPQAGTKADISESTGRAKIDFWSERMIKADPKGSEQKANLNYKSEQERNQNFINARFNAVWRNDPASLETVAKVYNDWNDGDKAAKTLKAAARLQPQVATKAEYQTDLAEAERLQGKYAAAENRVEAVLRRDPNNSTASYLKGKIALSNTKTVENLAKARSFLSQALADHSSTLDETLVEQELKDALRENAVQSFSSLKEKPLCQENPNEGISYSGTVDLPPLETGKGKISGPATLFIVGNQFMLKTEPGTFSGTVATVSTGSYNAVALRFDDALRGPYENGVTISLRAQGTCEKLRLDGTNTAGGIQITATKGSGDASVPRRPRP